MENAGWRVAVGACLRAALAALLLQPEFAAADETTAARCEAPPPAPQGRIQRAEKEGKGLYAVAQAEDPVPLGTDIGGADCAEQIPLAAGAITRNGTQHCSGVLVAPSVVVTAAHCLVGFTATSFEFRVGPMGDHPTHSAQAYFADYHGHYKKRGLLGGNDIGVLYLDKELAGVEPLQFRTEPYEAPPDGQLTFVGYGNPGSPTPGRKRCLTMEVRRVCEGSFDYDGKDARPCRGDSGGAALDRQGDRYVLAGLTSWGTEECTGPGVSVDAGEYYHFINSWIADAPKVRARIRPVAPSQVLRWSPVATAAATVGLGIYGVLQFGEERRLHDRAVGMINPDGTLNSDAKRYNQALADSRAAGSSARLAGYVAGGALVATVVLAYFSYRDGRAVGPFRF